VGDAGRDHLLQAALAAWRRAHQTAAYPDGKSRVVRSLLGRHAGGRTLIFTPDNATTYAIAVGHGASPITCDTKRRERKRVLEEFTAGGIGALVSAQVLNEGLDVPEADTGIIVGGAGGQREFTQRLGRLLRPAAGKRARIYDLVTAASVDARRRSRSGVPGSAER